MWGGNQVVRNQQAMAAANLPRPKLTPLWGAGLSFSKCHSETRVRYDPHLPQIFDGEEFSRASRLWTNGYDMYTPTRGIVFHDYMQKMAEGLGEVAVWNFAPPPEAADLKVREEEASKLRLYTLLGIPGGDGQDLGEYGMGDVRSYDAYIKFSGIDPKHHIKGEGSCCGNLEWVPYENQPPPPPTEAVGLADALGQTSDADAVDAPEVSGACGAALAACHCC